MNSFLQFARTAEKVGATTKRLEKAAFLREFFETLNDADLPIAARFFAGQASSLGDQRTRNIGGTALFNAIAEISGVSIEDLKAQIVKTGELIRAWKSSHRRTENRFGSYF